MIVQKQVIEVFSEPPPEDKGWILFYEGDMSIHSLQTLARNYASIDFKIYVQALGRKPMGNLEYFASKVYACKIKAA